MISKAIIITRLLVVFICSFVFAIERRKSNNVIEFGTYIFIALGSCTAAVLANILTPDNPLALLAAVVSGAGFIGAGAILKRNDSASGFIHAATIWAFAIFGVLIGSGEHFIGAILYIMMELVILFDFYLEYHGMGTYRKKVQITTNKMVSLSEIDSCLTGLKHKTFNGSEYDKLNKTMVFTYYIEGKKKLVNELPQKLSSKSWFSKCSVEQL